jgi:hypothetical protein
VSAPHAGMSNDRTESKQVRVFMFPRNLEIA